MDDLIYKHFAISSNGHHDIGDIEGMFIDRVNNEQELRNTEVLSEWAYRLAMGHWLLMALMLTIL